MTSKDHQKRRSATRLQGASWLGTLRRPADFGIGGFAFLAGGHGRGLFGFPTDEVVAFASCQCRLMIFGSTGERLSRRAKSWLAGGNADWAGVSGRA